MKSRRFDGGSEVQNNNMTKKLEQMQNDLQKVSNGLEEKSFITKVGGGAVEVKLNGNKNVLDIKIKKELIEDIEMLEDSLTAALNSCMELVDQYTDKELSKITKGVSIPGMPKLGMF